MKKKIVVIGGGTGLSAILRGLRDLPYHASAIVSMADDGGSSGLLRRDLDMLPPGDLRNCLLALSEEPEKTNELFNYRFHKGSLSGHNLGNLILAALEDIHGGMEEAVFNFSEIFKIKGEVFPVTLDSIRIMGKLENGNQILGESILPIESLAQKSPIDSINLHPHRPRAFKKAIEAIEQADLILVGPGSLYTSILPALLVSGIKETVYSSKAPCYLMGNLMTQPGETDEMSFRLHHSKIIEHIEDEIFQGMVINVDRANPQAMQKYLDQGAKQILWTDEDEEYFQDRSIRIVKANLLDRSDSLIRHSSHKVREIVRELIL